MAEHRVQEVALAFMAIVYTVRLVWLFRFRRARDRQPPTGWPRTNAAKGACYSMAAIAMPWSMESTRTKPGFYAQFVVFHLAVAANIVLSFVIPYGPGLLQSVALVRLLQVVIGAGFVVGVIRMIRRVSDPVVRRISTPDDIFSLGLLIVWFLAGVAAAPNSVANGELHLVVYFLLTAFFLIYVPFSKISHYLYYPFTRYWLGRTLGYRGVFPIEHVNGSGTHYLRTISPGTVAADVAQGPS
jgi:nitrate reductase gamma subunit